ncbi:hypothetical protein OG902_39105 [Streptomyces sp. NBC_01768]|nr:hypothetical protein OG902_39105 [Streptomyces sp. NBC_01768]
MNTRRRNPAYFPDVELPGSVTATTDLAAALDGADYLVDELPGGQPGVFRSPCLAVFGVTGERQRRRRSRRPPAPPARRADVPPHSPAHRHGPRRHPIWPG